jgi:hypothetical protein
MNALSHPILALSIYPFRRGFAFVLFEGDRNPIDWAVKEIREKHRNTKTFEAVKAVLEQYQPDIIVTEDTSDRESRRSSRIRKLYRMIIRLAATRGTGVFRYTKAQVRERFHSRPGTKYQIARAVASLIPAFGHRMPRIRRPWMADDFRMSLFDAAALGLTFFARTRPGPR